MRKREAKIPPALDEKLDGYTVPNTAAYWQDLEKMLDKDEAKAARRKMVRVGLAAICLCGLIACLCWLFYLAAEIQSPNAKLPAPAGESNIAEKAPARNTPQTEIESPDHINTSTQKSKASSSCSTPTRTIPRKGISDHRKGGSIHNTLSGKSSKTDNSMPPGEVSRNQQAASDVQSKPAPGKPEKMQKPLLAPLFRLSLNESGNITHSPLIQKSKKKNAWLLSETGVIIEGIGSVPSYPGTGITMKPAFKAGIYREQKLVNRFVVLAEPCLVYRTGYSLEKSSVQNRYFLTHQVEKTSITTHSILSLDIPLALELNINRHALTGGIYTSLLVNALSTVTKTSQMGKTSAESEKKNAWNYKAGLRKTAYGLSAGYIYRKDERMSFAASYIFFLSGLTQSGYYEGAPSGMCELQFGLRYNLLNK